MPEPSDVLRRGDAVIVVHIQRDFLPGGALPVPEGREVIPVMNEWIEAALKKGLPVIYSRDYHPWRHPSFRSEGGPWPAHCVQDSEGARFHPDLILPERPVLATGGTRFDRDQYSAFDQTGLDGLLRRDGVSRLFLGGLALDYCVRATALDAAREGFATHVLLAAARAIAGDTGQAAVEALRSAGVRVEEDPCG